MQVITLGGLVWFLVYLISGLVPDDAQSSQSTSTTSSQVASSTPSTSSANLNSNSDLDYLERLKPRIPDLLHTAPIYDDLTDPVSFPRIAACVVIPRSPFCQCYSQQATKLSVSEQSCYSIVHNGYFDPTVPDIRVSAQGASISSP